MDFQDASGALFSSDTWSIYLIIPNDPYHGEMERMPPLLLSNLQELDDIMNGLKIF